MRGKLIGVALGVVIAAAGLGLQACSDSPTGAEPQSVRLLASTTGTGSLGANKSATGFWYTKKLHDWSASKVLKSPSSLVALPAGSSVDLVFTASLVRTPMGEVNYSGAKGSVCVVNNGSEATSGLAISEMVHISMDGGATFSPHTPAQPVSVAARPVLDPGESACYPYEVNFTPTSGATYKNVASITTNNYPALEATSGFTIPAAPESVILDGLVDIEDRITCPSGFSCTPISPSAGLQPSGWSFANQGTSLTMDLVVRVTNSAASCGIFEFVNTLVAQEKSNDGTLTERRSASVSVTLDAGACAPEFAGCTPGFWKQTQHFQYWTGYSTTQSVGSVFSSASLYSLDSFTLLEGLSFPGGTSLRGAAEILLRGGIAAALNAAHPTVTYEFSTSWIVSNVESALASGSRDTMLDLASQLDAANNRTCTLTD